MVRANCTGTHAEAGPDGPAGRGTQNIRSAWTICAARIQMDLSLFLGALKAPLRTLPCFIFRYKEGKVVAPPPPKKKKKKNPVPSHFPPRRIKSATRTYNLFPVAHSSPRTSFRGKNKERTGLRTTGGCLCADPVSGFPPSFKAGAEHGDKMNWFLGQRGCTNQCPIHPLPSIHHPFSGPGTSWHCSFFLGWRRGY